MTVHKLNVSDEELADAAISFVHADLNRRIELVERNQMLINLSCLRQVNNEKADGCFDALKTAQIFDKEELCDNCKIIDLKTKRVRQANAVRNGKLTRLRTLVKRREASTK